MLIDIRKTISSDVDFAGLLDTRFSLLGSLDVNNTRGTVQDTLVVNAFFVGNASELSRRLAPAAAHYSSFRNHQESTLDSLLLSYLQ